MTDLLFSYHNSIQYTDTGISIIGHTLPFGLTIEAN